MAIAVRRAVTINRPLPDVYGFWRRLENLPRFMAHLESVTETGDGVSHWVAKAPGGTVEWDAELVEEREGELLAWRSKPDTAIPNAGEVRFGQAPTGRGTEVHVALTYEPPAGAAGAAFAKLLGEEPDQQVREDLRRFKQVMEAGEVPTTEGQPSGRPPKREADRPQDGPATADHQTDGGRPTAPAEGTTR